jgi:hypothetical protein
LAAFRLQDGRPQVVVVSGARRLYTNHVDANGEWQGRWQPLAGPAGLNGFLDVAATSDATGLPQLYVIGSDHALYSMRASSASTGATWGPWAMLSSAVEAQRVSVVRHGDGRQQVFVVSTTGAVRSLWQIDATPGAAWSMPIDFGSIDLPPLFDLDAAWTPDGRVQVFAIDGKGNGWTRTADGLTPLATWSPWASWSVPLYAPQAATPPMLDGIVSLTASRWEESAVPVVFATDQQGNIYVTTYVDGQWQPWRSFYN